MLRQLSNMANPGVADVEYQPKTWYRCHFQNQRGYTVVGGHDI
jgi:hypothetical protein